MRHVRLKTSFGIPCRMVGGGQSAVWNGDRIAILLRIGSHYLCRVVYGSTIYGHQMMVWLHKRAVREFPTAKAVNAEA